MEMENVPFSLENQYFDNNAHTAEHTGQIDYVNPINDKHYIDAGMKYIYRLNASDSKYFIQQSDGSMLQDNNMSSIFDQGQSIVATYADYQLKLKKFGFKAGVRYEHTFMDVKYDLQPERNFNAGFDDVVPTVNMSYMLGTTSTLKANYNMRINRPGIWYLNPFRDESNPTSVSYGNPNLDTEKAHIIGLTFSSFTAKFSVNANLNYTFTNNGIESYSFMEDGILNNTYENAGKKQITRLSLWMNWNPGNKTRISINASGSYSDYSSDILDTKNSGFNGNVFGNIQQTLPWDLRLSVYGGGSTPYITLQGKGSSYYYYGLGLTRSFLKEKRLSISLSANNIFNKYNTYESNTLTDTFRSWNKNKYYNLGYALSISWRFGELKTQVKKTSRTINNDDVKSGGSSSQGSSTGGQGGM